jgi:hypothetical protein
VSSLDRDGAVQADGSYLLYSFLQKTIVLISNLQHSLQWVFGYLYIHDSY